MPALLLCAAVAAALLSFSVLTAAPFSLPKFVFAGTLAFAAFAASAFAAATGRRPFAVCGPDAAVAAMLGAVGIASFFSVDPPLSWLGHYEFYAYGFAACVVYALLYASAAQLRNPRERRWVTRTLALAGAAAGVVGVLQAAGVEPFPGVPTAAAFGGRAISVFGNPVYAGAVFAVLLPVCVFEATEDGKINPLFAAAAAALLAGAAATKARGALGAGAAGTAFFFWAKGALRFRGIPGRKAGWALAAAVLIFAAGAAIVGGKRDSDRARLELWRLSGSVFASRPVIGVGPSGFGNAFRRVRSLDFIQTLGARASQANAHNDVLEVLCATGLVGAAAYAWLLAAAFLCCRRALDGPDRRAAAAFGGAGVALFLQAKVNPVPFAALAAWAVIFGLTASIESEKRSVRRGAVAGAIAAFLLAAGAVFSVVGWRIARADRAALRARVYRSVGKAEWADGNFRAAIALNPYETEYRMKYLSFLFERARREADPARKRMLAETAVSYARAATRLRPAHPDSHQMLGFALMTLGDLGDRNAYLEASRELDAALEMDPRFPVLLRMRGALAEKTGDDLTAESMRERLQELSAGASR